MRSFGSKGYDAAMRLPVIFISAWFCWREFMSLRELVVGHPFFEGDAAFLAAVLSHVGVIAFLGFLLFLHAIRRRPVSKYEAWQPKLAALLGMCTIYLLMLLPRARPDYFMDAASSLLSFTGNFLCLVSVTSLGRSLSIMPEARSLKTEGPYARIRHPLYMSEFIALAGIFLMYRSWAAAAVLASTVYFQLKRMDWEEKILSETFTEYIAYRANSWRLVPGIY